MYKFIDGDYYGLRDEEDGVLAAVEGTAEAAARAEVSTISMIEEVSHRCSMLNMHAAASRDEEDGVLAAVGRPAKAAARAEVPFTDS